MTQSSSEKKKFRKSLKEKKKNITQRLSASAATIASTIGLKNLEIEGNSFLRCKPLQATC